MTKTAFDHHHHKPPHHHHHHDEETTAYSSWHDEEDSNSQLSSCLSSVDSHDVHAACVGEEEDEQFLHNRGSVILLSSPECPLLDHNDVEDDDIAANNCSSLLTSDYGSLKMEKEEVNNRMFEFQELSEQASYLLQRESSPEYAVDDYFQRSYYDVDNTSCRSPAHESTGGIEYLIPLSPDNSTSHRKSTPIDRSCRSKMMEWSYRIIEVSFPPPASQQQEHQDSLGSSTRSHNQSRKRNIRQHSTESLQLISTTFSYIDRICTKFKVVDRDEYKLLSMVCLTLAAKSSGLFCTENEREWYEFFNNQQYSDACCKHEHRSEHTVTTASLSSSSSFDNIIDSSSSKNSEFTGQTILSTPGQDDAEMQGQLQQPRPLMDLISLPGLHALCNGLYTKKQLYEMEYIILHRGLDWRLNSVQAIDWLDLCLEISSLLHLDGNRSLAEDEYNDLREAAMVQLEYAVEISSFIGYAPSLLAVAAFLNAVDGYNDSGDCILDCIEEVVGLSFDRSEMVKVRNIMRV